jgi:PASTA domain
MFKRTVECLFIIALLAGLLAGNAGATMYYYNIPDVKNLPKAECEKALKAKKYFTEIIWVEVEAEMYTQIGKCQGTEPYGMIFVAEPKNFPIKVKIATKGNFVPMTLLMPEAAAIDAVKKAGYVPKVEYYSEEITNMAGKVKASQPEPYRNLAKGGTVLLKVAKPGYPMPDFIGKNAGGALQTIQQLNDVKKLALKGTVVPGKTTTVAQDDQKVYEQSPAAGSVLSAGSEIKLAAYKYVKPGTIIMPNLIGKTEKEAVATLAAARLKVDVRYGPSPRQINLKNRVMQQSVSAGSETAGPIVLTVGK